MFQGGGQGWRIRGRGGGRPKIIVQIPNAKFKQNETHQNIMNTEK
jgi:hypothetical protein